MDVRKRLCANCRHFQAVRSQMNVGGTFGNTLGYCSEKFQRGEFEMVMGTQWCRFHQR